MTHIHLYGIIFGFKTGKTKCGKTVKLAGLAAPGQPADCPECRAEIDKEIAQTRALVAQLQSDPTRADMVKVLRDSATHLQAYTNADGLIPHLLKLRAGPSCALP